MYWLFGICAVVGLAASIQDFRERKVSNVISLSALILGIGVQTYLAGWSGLGNALLGSVVGFVVFLIFYMLGGMGGGDIKLMAGLGALMQPMQVVTAAIMTALIGGVMALGYLCYRLVRPGPPADGAADESRPRKLLKAAIPYAPAITLGVLLSFLSLEGFTFGGLLVE